MKIGVGLCFWQDYNSLERMLESLQRYPIDPIIAVDGKFPEHPASQEQSDQACIDLLNKQRLPYVYMCEPLTQVAKRQKYFDFCKGSNIDALIIMDSDDYIDHKRTDWDSFELDLKNKTDRDNPEYSQSFCVVTMLPDKGAGIAANLPRVFHRPEICRYLGTHYKIFSEKTAAELTYRRDNVIKGLTLAHDHELRDKKYSEQMLVYERREMIREGRTPKF